MAERVVQRAVVQRAMVQQRGVHQQSGSSGMAAKGEARSRGDGQDRSGGVSNRYTDPTINRLTGRSTRQPEVTQI